MCFPRNNNTLRVSSLSRIKAASKERKRERRRTTTNALRLVGLGRRSPGYVFCILLLLQRCEEITIFYQSCFFLSCFFFCISSSNEIKIIDGFFLFLSQKKQSNIKKEVRVREKKCQNHENPKPRSETKEARATLLKSTRVWSQGETF
jgi:hypothetical protein